MIACDQELKQALMTDHSYYRQNLFQQKRRNVTRKKKKWYQKITIIENR